MLRSCFLQGSRSISVASTSRCAGFHSPSILQDEIPRSQPRKRGEVRNSKKTNLERQEEREQLALADRPSVVLGTRPSQEEQKWRNCYLRKVVVDENELTSENIELQPTEILGVGTVHMPKHLAFGVGEPEKKILFQHLPVLSSRGATFAATSRGQSGDLFRLDDEAVKKESQKANNFAKILDLRNANAAGITYENKKRIIYAFSTPDLPFNPGRAEVQAAILTYRIRKLWSHLTKFKRDVGNRRGLRLLVHQRAKILRYLKSVDRDRYEEVLLQLALEPESVEGELVV